MQAPGSLLNPEQKAVLGTVFHFIEMAVVYLRSILPVVGEVDERPVAIRYLQEANLKSLVELAESCLRNLPLFFPELRELEQERAKRGGQ